MKLRILIGALLCAAFILISTVRIETAAAGPRSGDEIDDLGIKTAYISSDRKLLLLNANDRSFTVSLESLEDGLRRKKNQDIPRNFNTIHWKAGKIGSAPNSGDFLPVDIRTNEYASFGYKSDGRPWHNHEEPAVARPGFQYTLFRGPAEEGPRGIYLKSYIILTSDEQSDGSHGFQIFFDPDVNYRLGWQYPGLLIVFGPAFLGLLIAGFTASSKVRWGIAIPLFAVSIVLYGVSVGLVVVITSIGAGWNGSGSKGIPLFMIVPGLGGLGLMVLGKLLFRKTDS